MRGKPFEPGNKVGRGRPLGSRNKATLLAQQTLDSNSPALVRKCILMALQGDTKAMQICMDRILPARRELPVRIGKISTRTTADLGNASEAVTQRVIEGKLTPSQGKAVADMIEQRRKVIETGDLDNRLRTMEEQCAA